VWLCSYCICTQISGHSCKSHDARWLRVWCGVETIYLYSVILLETTLSIYTSRQGQLFRDHSREHPCHKGRNDCPSVVVVILNPTHFQEAMDIGIPARLRHPNVHPNPLFQKTTANLAEPLAPCVRGSFLGQLFQMTFQFIQFANHIVAHLFQCLALTEGTHQSKVKRLLHILPLGSREDAGIGETPSRVERLNHILGSCSVDAVQSCPSVGGVALGDTGRILGEVHSVCEVVRGVVFFCFCRFFSQWVVWLCSYCICTQISGHSCKSHYARWLRVDAWGWIIYLYTDNFIGGKGQLARAGMHWAGAVASVMT